MSVERKDIVVNKLPNSHGHIASTDVIVKEQSVWVSTVRRFEGDGLFETLIFKPKEYPVPVEEPEISKFNKTRMTEKEAIRNHRKAVTASVRLLISKS
jgi:hypothetical protein